MEIINHTRYQAKVSQSIEADGHRFAIIMVKATYQFPKNNDGRPRPSAEQHPILLADSYLGEPGFSTPLEECDIAPEKRRCDVIINACGYTENAKPAKELLVAAKVSSMEKRIQIVGDRKWKNTLFGPTPSKTESFTRIPIHYSRAFGGMWLNNEKNHSIAYEENPIGCGFSRGKFVKLLVGKNLPNLSEVGKVVTDHSKNYKPQSFGPIGRSWSPRKIHAGTYDENWKENIFPLPPSDLDISFNQSTPEDQQIEFPIGGEEIVLLNLHPERHLIRFCLPPLTLPIHLVDRKYNYQALKPVVDTLSVDAESSSFTVLWRARHPIYRSLNEIEAVVIGNGFRLWYKRKISGEDCCDKKESKKTNSYPADQVNKVNS